MKSLRTDLLEGKKPEACSACYYEESFGKINGRVRQLNKSAILLDDFANSTRSSPHYGNFLYSYNHNGESNYKPTDFQIDLGNVCNSACIMCEPAASSKLTADYQKLHKINPKLFVKPNNYKSWTQNPALLEKFITELEAIDDIKYIHLLGGETLYDEAFYSICERLIKTGQAKNIIVGTTTNGTIYNDRLAVLIKEFKQFHLGISIESVTELNDYVRWPGKIIDIKENIQSFLNLRKQCPDLAISIRITPNIFTIYEFDKLAEFLIENSVIAESCNILYNPAVLRMELMPEDIRQEVITKFKNLIDRYDLKKSKVYNVRRKDLIPDVVANVILDYYNFICTYTVPDNAEELRYQLVDFLKAFESIRDNSILDYAPRYKDFLRSYGY